MDHANVVSTARPMYQKQPAPPRAPLTASEGHRKLEMPPALQQE